MRSEGLELDILDVSNMDSIDLDPPSVFGLLRIEQ